MSWHCLDNFFGLVPHPILPERDDRAVPAMPLIVKTTIVAEIMHDLPIKVQH
jgi:hypothetical protein